MSINTDSRAISDTTLSREYNLISEAFGWGREHFLKTNLEAIRHAFAPEVLKERLQEQIREAYIISSGDM
jgi:adenosine deaminase